jgi:hypothetical protein
MLTKFPVKLAILGRSYAVSPEYASGDDDEVNLCYQHQMPWFFAILQLAL